MKGSLKYFILFFLILCCTIGKAQVCDTVDNGKADLYKKAIKKYQKKVSNKIYGKVDPDLVFGAANYMRHNNDTTCLQWYRYCIELYRRAYEDNDNKRYQGKRNVIYAIGKCYYYLSDYKQSVQWFAKAIKAKTPDICTFYFYSVSLKQLGQDKDADDAMQQFNNPPK